MRAVLSNMRMVKQFPVIEIFAMSPMSIEMSACLHQIDTNDLEGTVHRFAMFSAKKSKYVLILIFNGNAN